MLEGYFDDSGTHAGSAVTAVVGWLGREEQIHLFAEEWRTLLREERIVTFHMTDLESLRGEFSRENGWDENRKRRVLSRVFSTARKWAKYSIGGLAIVEDHDAMVPDWAKQSAAFGDAYNFCFQICVGKILRKIESFAPPMPTKDQIALVFDQQEKREGVTRNTYSQIKKFRDPADRLGTLAFASKDRVLPLQLADLFAYESYKHLSNALAKSGRPIRAPLKCLVADGGDLDVSYFKRHDLQRLVSDYDKRGRPSETNEPWWPWQGVGI